MYLRITTYHPEHNVCCILDSNGKFNKLSDFTAYLISKGFKIIKSRPEGSFDFGNMPRAELDPENIIIRACGKGQPIINGKDVTVRSKTYSVQ